MILDEYVTVGISPLTLKWFEKRGYEIPGKRDKKGRINYTSRRIIFDLTAEQFKELIAQPCHYCGGFSSDYDKSR